ncbi:hypothetical protein BN844_1996 [Pseudomonas sp. SHC52]|nr:hypothetical protein BN844_1996 [Pseudomonas sp. SHC52]
MLTDCDTTTQQNARFTFSGVQDPVVPALFATTGLAQNVAFVCRPTPAKCSTTANNKLLLSPTERQ